MSVAKGLKVKVRKWGLSLTFVEVAGEKLVWGDFSAPHPPFMLAKSGHYHGHFPSFFLSYFIQWKQWQIFLPTTTSVKTSENNTNFRKIKTTVWKDICISSSYA